MKKYCLLISLVFSCLLTSGQDWVQMGNTINLFPNTHLTNVAIVKHDSISFAVANNDYTSEYTYKAGAWSKSYADLYAKCTYHHEAENLSASGSNTLAYGREINAMSFPNSGWLIVYEKNGNSWVQKGDSILQSTEHGISFGGGHSMPDPNTVAVTYKGYLTDSLDNSEGAAMVFEYVGNNWVQKGSTISSNANYQGLHGSLGMSVNMPNKNTLAVSFPRDADSPPPPFTSINEGRVKVYEYDSLLTQDWALKGAEISIAGYSSPITKVIMPNQNTVGFIYTGHYSENGNLNHGGILAIYEFVSGTWTPKGNIIPLHKDFRTYSGQISMIDEENVAVLFKYSHWDGQQFKYPGLVKVYTFDGVDWVQRGSAIQNQLTDSVKVKDIALLSENRLAVTYSDYTKVFEFREGLANQQFSASLEFSCFPNPFNNSITLSYPAYIQVNKLLVSDLQGKIIFEQDTPVTKQLSLPHLPDGMYLISLLTDQGIKTKLIAKQR